MKKVLFSLTLLFSMNIYSQSAQEVVTNFFEALSSKDIETLKRLTVDDMNLHSLSLSSQIKSSSTSKQAFLDGFKNIPENVNIEVRIFDIKSLLSENLAQFKVPYEFYVNNKLSHSGINVLTLLNTEDGWKISYIADTRKK